MNNFQKIKDNLKNKPYDAYLITGGTNRLYASGFASSAGVLLISSSDVWLFIDGRYFEGASNAVPEAIIKKTSKELTYDVLIIEVISERGFKSIAVEEKVLTAAEFRNFNEKLNASLLDGSDDLNALRAVKSPEELQLMINAQRISERAFESILPLISPNITEKQLAAELTSAMLRFGADDKSFKPIVVCAPRSSMPHASPTDQKLGRGFLTMDFGCRLNGWCSDTTRTVMLGKPTDEEKLVYNTVLEAQLAGIAYAKAGVTGISVHETAADVIRKAGFGEYFDHGFGHGLGLEVHETPNANLLNKEPLPAGAVISAEPGIYLPGRYGVRIEDILYITETGNINITNLPKELMVIDI